MRLMSFTPHDPTEDTERVEPEPASQRLGASFTPHDPTEDTESILGGDITKKVKRFHPPRSDRGY